MQLTTLLPDVKQLFSAGVSCDEHSEMVHMLYKLCLARVQPVFFLSFD